MNLKYEHNYDDIINLEHHVSKKHPPMSLYARSAQFAPFAALTGYEDAVRETARETSEQIDIDDEIKAILDGKIQILSEQIKKKPEVSITYFIHDLKKEGGAYITVEGIIKKIDTYNQNIVLVDRTEIQINDIIDITGKIFNIYEQNNS